MIGLLQALAAWIVFSIILVAGIHLYCTHHEKGPQ